MSEDLILMLKTWLPIILSAIMFLLSFICVGKSKNNCKTQSFLSLLEDLPIFIKDAENKGFSNGDSKLRYVVTLCICKLATSMNKSTDFVQEKYEELIVNYVEQILSTPEKKEVIKYEKKDDE